jgi:hypothetical protein
MTRSTAASKSARFAGALCRSLATHAVLDFSDRRGSAVQPLTDEEKHLVSSVLRNPPGRKEAIFEYGVYLAPSVLFAAYGLWRHDFVAEFVAFCGLLIAVLVYLSYTRHSSKVYYSLLRKYEEETGALTPPGQNRNRKRGRVS